MSAHGHAPAHAHAPHGGAGHAAGHPAHHRNYVKIWGILVALLVVSVVGPMFGIRLITLITAFGIALVKAYLVAKNFMHLDVEKPIIHWLLAISLALMVVLFYGVASDVMRDGGRNWKKDAGFHHVGTPGGHAPAAGHEGAAPATGHGEAAPATGQGGAADTSHGATGH